MCVNSLLLFWQEKSHRVLHESKMNLWRTLWNLEKFWFSRNIRIGGGGFSLQDLNGSGNNCDGQITQSGSTRVCSAGLNSPLPWQRQHGLFPKILQHPQHSGGFQPTQPSTPSLGTAWEALRAVGLNYSDNLSHSSSWSRRGNPRWEAGSDPAFCRTISEPLSVPVYLSAL